MKIQSISDVDLNGKVIVIKEKVMNAQYKGIEHRMLRANGGFGCNPSSIGTAVFTTSILLPTELNERWARCDVEGWVDENEADKLITKFKLGVLTDA